MKVTSSPIFVADTKIIFGYDFVAQKTVFVFSLELLSSLNNMSNSSSFDNFSNKEVGYLFYFIESTYFYSIIDSV